eukprot:92516-Amphidinium_carterae.1
MALLFTLWGFLRWARRQRKVLSIARCNKHKAVSNPQWCSRSWTARLQLTLDPALKCVYPGEVPLP